MNLEIFLINLFGLKHTEEKNAAYQRTKESLKYVYTADEWEYGIHKANDANQEQEQSRKRKQNQQQ